MKRTKSDYEYAIRGLRDVQKVIQSFLDRGEREIHKDMWQVSPGIWISNDYQTLDEALNFLRKVIQA